MGCARLLRAWRSPQPLQSSATLTRLDELRRLPRSALRSRLRQLGVPKLEVQSLGPGALVEAVALKNLLCDLSGKEKNARKEALVALQLRGPHMPREVLELAITGMMSTDIEKLMRNWKREQIVQALVMGTLIKCAMGDDARHREIALEVLRSFVPGSEVLQWAFSFAGVNHDCCQEHSRGAVLSSLREHLQEEALVRGSVEVDAGFSDWITEDTSVRPAPESARRRGGENETHVVLDISSADLCTDKLKRKNPFPSRVASAQKSYREEKFEELDRRLANLLDNDATEGRVLPKISTG